MSNDSKNIHVVFNFASYEDPNKRLLRTFDQVGYITESELEILMSAFNTESAPNACISSMELKFTEEVYFSSYCPFRSRSLLLSEMFSRHTKPLCCKCSDNLKEVTKIKRCINNLRNGKCCDEFIRNTLGAVLFPQHYAKDKQK